VDSPNALHSLDPSLHDFAPSTFGTIEDLKQLQPNSDGWSAAMVCCSEFGFQPDQNSIFDIGELYTVQNFGNVILPWGEDKVVTEISHVLQEKQLKDLIVFGHVGCKTVEHFLWEDRDIEWLQHGDKLRDFMSLHYGDVSAENQLSIAAQENILLQLKKEMLSLHEHGVEARLHGWLSIGLGNRIMRYDVQSGQFV
jgi:carbonic anhydrase